jgi:hypothetical protein
MYPDVVISRSAYDFEIVLILHLKEHLDISIIYLILIVKIIK